MTFGSSIPRPNRWLLDPAAMKSPFFLTAAGALLLILAGSLLLPRSKEARSSLENSPADRATSRLAKGHGTQSVAPPRADAEPVDRTVELGDDELAAILSTIEEASVTYDSKALPLIEPFLLHADPRVRQAAMNGMIVLGEAAAGPLLRKAAGKAPSPREAVALADAADFVELPSGTFVPKERTAPGTRTPMEANPAERTKSRLPPPVVPEVPPSSPVE